jgi:AAA family ATP:ADP antiporter
MLQRLAGKLPVKRGEGRVTSLMFLYIFGVMTLYYVLKPLRSALFLTNFPASQLAYAYLLTALFAGTLAALIFRLTRHLSAIRMLTAVNLGIIATLLLFRWAMGRPITWLPYAYFIYVQMVSGLSTAMFWLLAGYLYDSRQSRRIFPLLGLGGVLGAMSGSVIPGFLSNRLSVQSMVLICAAVCAVLILLGRAAWHHRRAPAESKAARRSADRESGAGDIVRTVFTSRHLSLMVLSAFLAIIASQLVDWQLNDAAKRAYQALPKAEQSTAIGELFARLNFATNILGAVVQLALTGTIVRKFGVGAAILFLPAGLLGASVGVLLYPGLAAAVLALGVNNVFEHSLYRVGRELLYLPLSPDARKKVKVFIDVFADKCGRGAAGVIILVIAGTLPGVLAVRSTAAVVILLSALCILLSLWLRESYQDVLRRHLSRCEIDLAGIGRFVEDPGAVRLLVSALEARGERQILYALYLLQSLRGVDFSARLLPLLKHHSPFVREEAVRTLAVLPVSHSGEAEVLLDDPSDRVRSAAVGYLCSGVPGDPSARLDKLLTSSRTDIRIAAARWLAENPQVPYRPPAGLVGSLMIDSGPCRAGARVAAAFLAARLPAGESVPFLRDRLEDPDPAVVEAAAAAAASSGHADLVRDLVRLLKSPRNRAAAREALVSFGSHITGTLGDLLADEAGDPLIRREIPWVLGRIATVPSCELLLNRLDDCDRQVRYRSVKALNRMREQNPDLPRPRPAIRSRIFAETGAYYETLLACRSLAAPHGTGGSALLLTSLRARMGQNLEMIFRLLGLQYPVRDIYSAFSALRGGGGGRRTSAIEFLDSLLSRDLRAVILPLVEESSTERLADLAARNFGVRMKTREEALEALLEQNDEWLVACALHEIGSGGIKAKEGRCRALMEDGRPLVRETASWAVRRLAT